jgi:hypothetical protein
MHPSKLAKIARRLVALPGVIGVFRGIRRRGGRWTAEPALAVHVRRKRPASKIPSEERIPGQLEGLETDVVAVGRPRLHAEVDSNDQLVAAYDQWQRRSALSALAQDGSGGVIALRSGHGLLPIANDAYQSGAWTSDAKGVYVFSDPADTAGALSFGTLNESVDFAIVRFSTLEPPIALLGHTLCALPIPVRDTDVVLGEVVQHEAPKRGYRVTGVVTGKRPPQPVVLRSGEGFDIRYADVFTVSGSYVPFSLPGESGSLVFDDARRALGFVVGGGKDPDNPSLTTTYVLRNFSALRQQMGNEFSLFFGGP